MVLVYLHKRLYIYVLLFNMNINTPRKRRSIELKKMRVEKHLTQCELSAISGLTQATISRIESGVIGWNIDSEIIYFETLNNYIAIDKKAS